AVADVAVRLDERALLVDDRVRLPERHAEHRLLPVLDGTVGGEDVDRPALAAVAGRAAELLRRVRLQDLRGGRAERLLGFLEALPVRGWWQEMQRSAWPSAGTQICCIPEGTVFAFSAPNFSAT